MVDIDIKLSELTACFGGVKEVIFLPQKYFSKR